MTNNLKKWDSCDSLERSTIGMVDGRSNPSYHTRRQKFRSCIFTTYDYVSTPTISAADCLQI